MAVIIVIRSPLFIPFNPPVKNQRPRIAIKTANSRCNVGNV